LNDSLKLEVSMTYYYIFIFLRWKSSWSEWNLWEFFGKSYTSQAFEILATFELF